MTRPCNLSTSPVPVAKYSFVSTKYPDIAADVPFIFEAVPVAKKLLESKLTSVSSNFPAVNSVAEQIEVPEGSDPVPAGTGSDPSGTSICSATELTAGKLDETLVSFDSSSFLATGTASNINGTSAAISGYLVDTNEYLATGTGDVDKLQGLVTFADAVTMTDSITSVTMSFNVGAGMSVYPESGTGKIIFGSGPFQAIISAN